MPSYDLSINGKNYTVDAPEDMPLLWVLRDILGLTGTKYGCGIAQCRACAVHINGALAYACQAQVRDVAGAKVVTIEGLETGQKEKLVNAWVEEDVPQCGWCQPGQVMAAAALLGANPSPTDEEIDEAMNPSICRCGTYNRIRRAIHRAAGQPL